MYLDSDTPGVLTVMISFCTLLMATAAGARRELVKGVLKKRGGGDFGGGGSYFL